jgi:tRNA(fMet)-specific endonuclease VapC
MARVIDTDVVSFLYKGDTRAELYRPHLASPPFILSFMTVAELRSWTRQRDWGADRQKALEAYLARYVILYANDALCDRWAEAMDSARRAGRPIAAADAWVAATALYQNVPVVTHNGSHFAGVAGLTVVSVKDDGAGRVS